MTRTRKRLLPGERAPRVILPCIDGSDFDTETLAEKRFMLSFFRFASCPLCNLRVHQLVQRFSELGEGFAIVAVFDSPLDNLARHAKGHDAPFPILADEAGTFYERYGIEHSIAGVLKGMILRVPAFVKALAKGYVPTNIQGSMTTMPADFLIDERGIIRTAYYGGDEGDHLLFEEVRAFAQGHEIGVRHPSSHRIGTATDS